MNIHGKCAFKRAHTHARTHKERRMRLSPPGWREFFRDKPGNCVAQFPLADFRFLESLILLAIRQGREGVGV